MADQALQCNKKNRYGRQQGRKAVVNEKDNMLTLETPNGASKKTYTNISDLQMKNTGDKTVLTFRAAADKVRTLTLTFNAQDGQLAYQKLQQFSKAAPVQVSHGSRKFEKDWELGGELGSGAYAVVKTCRHKVDGRIAAAKIIDMNTLQDSEKADLADEISILQSLQHEHVVQLYDVYHEAKKKYLVMELMQGGELFFRIEKKKQYTEKEARDLIKTLISTMAFWHNQDIVHRDLKPENLLLNSEENDTQFKVADWGLAKRISDQDLLYDNVGTIPYVAPEVLTGKGYGKEVDVWAVGVISYTLLCGYLPFGSYDPNKEIDNILHGAYEMDPEEWDFISAGAKDFIGRMLTVNRQKRWSVKQLLDHEWMHVDDIENDLGKSLQKLKEFNARRKLRAGIKTVLAANRFKNLFQNLAAEAAAPAADTSSL